MKPSYFNYFIENFPSSGETLVFNTRTQSIAVLEKSLARILSENKGKVIAIDEKEYESLLEEGFCIHNPSDEEEILDLWIEELIYSKNIIEATILVTYRCLSLIHI